MNGEHTCTFVEEREPSGRLIVGPCLGCTKPAFSALADAQATVEALQARLTALRELVGQWAWNTTNLLGDYRIATVADFNAEWTRRSIWLIEAVQATLPPPQAEQDQQTMYELRQQVEALQRENACKDTLIETLQAQLAQRGKDGGNE